MEKKYKGGLFVSLLLAVSFIFVYSSSVLAELSKPFSADMVSRFGKQVNKAKIYSSGAKMRTEMEGSIIIIRLDKNICWMVMPSEKMYMEQAIDQNMIPKTSQQVKGELERVSLGKETLEGKEVEKFKVTYNEKNKKLVMYQWLLNSGFPAKMAAEDESWVVEYKNIIFGGQADSLFEPPAGFQKFAMHMGGGSGMPNLDELMQQGNKER